MIRTGWLATALLVQSIAAAPASARILGDEECAAGRGPAALVTITGLKDRSGLIRAELFPATRRDFLRDDIELGQEGKPFRRVEVRLPGSGPVRLCLRASAGGDYAIGVFHSTDGVRKFNVRQHGVGFANNPRLGWGRPDVGKVTVTLGSNVADVPIVMNYLHGLAMRPLSNPPVDPAPSYAEDRK